MPILMIILFIMIYFLMFYYCTYKLKFNSYDKVNTIILSILFTPAFAILLVLSALIFVSSALLDLLQLPARIIKKNTFLYLKTFCYFIKTNAKEYIIRCHSIEFLNKLEGNEINFFTVKHVRDIADFFLFQHEEKMKKEYLEKHSYELINVYKNGYDFRTFYIDYVWCEDEYEVPKTGDFYDLLENWK